MSSEPAIGVERISKKYRIAGPQESYRTLREALTDAVTQPFRRALRLLQGNPSGAADLTREVWALREVSFEVAPGEVIGVIGRNGAGKSTLLKILARITSPTEGTARLSGRVGSLLEVGTGFHAELTGRENIYLSGAILGMRRSEIDRKLGSILEFAEVEKFADTPVKHYSSGMYLRLAFSVAAHLDPEILLVDEVLAVGDNEFQKKCLRKLGEAAGTGRTILFVSHNMAAIQALCPRTLLIADGRLDFDGPTAQAIEKYLLHGQPRPGARDLAEYRVSRGDAVLRSISVSGGDGEPRSVFATGSDIVLAFELSVAGSVRDPQIGLGVKNVLGTRIFTLRPSWQSHSFGTLEGAVTVRCHLENLRLMPGQYYLKATFGDRHSDFDVVEDVPIFEVMPDDFWGSGELPTPITQGLILQDAAWSHESSDGGTGETVPMGDPD